MARTPKLSDIQLILLTTACQRVDGSLLPPPDSIGEQGDRIRRAVAALLKRGFAEEIGASETSRVWREEGGHRIGIAVTDAGRSAIGAEIPCLTEAADTPLDRPIATGSTVIEEQPAILPAAEVVTARAGTKQALVLEMLQRGEGASLNELAEATSWLPHTTRAALTGLRKRGAGIVSQKADGVTRYRMPTAA